MDTAARINELRSDLLGRIEAFIAARGISEATFGRYAVNDSKFVRRLRASANIETRTLERADAFLRRGRSIVR